MSDNVTPFPAPRRRRRGALSNPEALAWLRQRRGIEAESYAALGAEWGWERSRTSKAVKSWKAAGHIDVIDTGKGGKVTIRLPAGGREFHGAADREFHGAAGREIPAAVGREIKREIPAVNGGQRLDVVRELREAAAPVVAAIAPPVMVRGHRAADVLAYTTAVALAGAAAWFSIKGMTVLFPGAPIAVVAMASAMEAGKLVTAGWLARQWRATAWVWRLVLAGLVVGLAVINAAGVYAQLVAAHVGERGAAQSAVDVDVGRIDARIEVAASKVGDLDKQIAQIDAAVAAATQRGKATTGLTAMEGQRKARAALAGEREKTAGALAALKAERAGVAAKGRQAETEAAPIMYVAELLGVGTDSERAIRWLIALMVLCCDPLAIALTAAASARRAAP